LFDKAKQVIMMISDLDHPDVPFEAILSIHIQNQLGAAMRSVIGDIEQRVQQTFNDMSPGQLWQCSPADFALRQSRVVRETSRSRVNCLCPFVHQLSPDVLQKFEDELDHTLESVCETAFLAAYAERLIPECKNSVLDTITTAINKEMAEVAAQSVGAYNFSLTSARYANQATSQRQNQLLRLYPQMV
jgi:hypothetical protein